MSKNDADEAVSVVSLTSSSGGYINGRNSANLELHEKLKTRLKETIHKYFSHRNYGSKFVVLGYNSTYFSGYPKDL
jgi:hypothetical protein